MSLLTTAFKTLLLVAVAASYLLAGCVSTPLSRSREYLIPATTRHPTARFRVPSGWRIGCISTDQGSIPPCGADYVLEHGSSQISLRANSGEFATRGTIDPVEEANILFLRELRGMHDPTYTLNNVTKAHSAYGDVNIYHFRGADSDSEPKAMVLLIDAGREIHCVVHAFTDREMEIALVGLEELLQSMRFLDRA